MLGSDGRKRTITKGNKSGWKPFIKQNANIKMEKLIQITSGRGPLECQWVVAGGSEGLS